MLITAKITSCDFTNTTFDSPQDGVAVIARGATGRWCEVLHASPAEKQRMINAGDTIYTPDEAKAIINADPGVNTIDF